MTDLQVLKALLPDNPLCGINTYKDTLNLATGDCMRRIKKLVLTGEETDWSMVESYTYFRLTNFADGIVGQVMCSHYVSPPDAISIYNTVQGIRIQDSSSYGRILLVRPPNFMTETLSGFKSYLQQQYANGTPVTVWYVLTTPTIETITVPSGLSGTEEGYLTQSETPTPTNPIYPTANEVLIWQHSLRKLTTATDTFTTLPVDIYADGNNATVGLKGNTLQSGTPTPDNPIMPQGTGERTAQLFDKSTAVAGYGVDNNSGNLFRSAALSASDYINISGESYIRATYITSGVANQYGAFYDENKTYISGYSGYSNVIAVPQNAVYTRITARTEYIDEFMFNLGSTPLPYEPYGYKIPISSASTTTPVYLGEAESTRRIKKLVLTGNEDWAYEDTYQRFGIEILDLYAVATRLQTVLCTHYPCIDDGRTIDRVPNNSVYVGAAIRNKLFVKTDSYTTIGTWKTYLAAQYAAGTPVTVWYVLATETTGIVNEPLMKIGDYTDTVSGIAIPTIASKDTFDVETTLKPSEVSLSYTGWHDATVKEYVSDTSIADLESISISQMENYTIQELEGGEWS